MGPGGAPPPGASVSPFVAGGGGCEARPGLNHGTVESPEPPRSGFGGPQHR